MPFISFRSLPAWHAFLCLACLMTSPGCHSTQPSTPSSKENLTSAPKDASTPSRADPTTQSGKAEPLKWLEFAIANNLPATLVPVAQKESSEMPGSDKTWSACYAGMAADPKTKELLKKLFRSEAVEIVALTEPPPAGFQPEPPRVKTAVYLGLYSPPAVHLRRGGRQPMRLTVAWFRAPPGMWITSQDMLLAVDCAINDYLLRQHAGYILSYRALNVPANTNPTEADLQKRLDGTIQRLSETYK